MRPSKRNRAIRTVGSLLLIAALALVSSPLIRTIWTTPVPLAGAAASAPDPKSPFGIAGVMRWPDWGTFSQPADAMLQTGGAWAREDFAWGLIEPRENVWDWTATDRIVSTLRSRGVNVLGIIAYSVNWATPAKDDDVSASPISFYTPDSSKYYAFVRTLVTHYKSSVRYWEVWNEPNSSMFWKPQPDGRTYAEVLKTAYKAVKDADPAATVLSGGVSGNAVSFLEDMIAQGAANSFDVLALHPYAVPTDPSKARDESRPEVHKLAEVELPKYKAFLQRHGLDKPIWITELGWPANNWQLDPNLQADYLAQAYAQLLASGLVDKIFWYSFKDDGGSPDQSWGLIGWGGGKMDLAPKRPAFSAYATSAKMLASTQGTGKSSFGSYQPIVDFEHPVAWERRDSPQGSLASSTEQHHAGSASGKLQYVLDAPSKNVDFAPPQPIPIQGRPTRLGIWVRGDSSGNYLSAWLRDKDGELFKVRFGAVSAPTQSEPWRYYEASINGYYFPYEMGPGNPSNGVVDYPISFVGFRLENTPDEPPASGTIYVDDLQAFYGPDVNSARFTRPDGLVVDVLWSVDPAQVDLPTRSTRAAVTDRDGNTRTYDAVNGNVSLQVSSAPIYVLHQAPQASASTGLAGVQGLDRTGSASSLCTASGKAQPLPAADDRFFPETGHNLSGDFRAFWETHGALSVLGFPITEEFPAPSSDGKVYIQQYFERARLEYHPENSPGSQVQLGLLGVWLTSGRNFQRAPATPSSPTMTYFAQSGHTLGLFKSWWEQNGGLAVFGYPISEEMQERNAADGKVYTVQYFERNRLEYHPSSGSGGQVMLGLLGVEYIKQQGCH